uniref:Uncharacterized protein n=1 Tax=Anguilla anguilla TaxID=7936 RepID=A0A0E9R439_ANGAN
MLFRNIKQACHECETIIMGGFNYPDINWEFMTGQGVRKNF